VSMPAGPPQEKKSRWPELTLGCGVGIALLTPLVVSLVSPSGFRSATNEAARRTQCRNNLHQIGLALHNYHDAYGCFPPAVTTDGTGRPMHSWTVYLLPFVDEQALYNAYNFQHAHNAPANTTVGQASLCQFMCPAVEGGRQNLTHYGMVVCPGSIGGVDRCTKLADITDGTSDTIVVVEMAQTACPWSSPAAVVDLTRGIHVPAGLPPGASSAHEGGVFALFADGQVRFLSDHIDLTLLRHLCTMAGGEQVNEDEY